MSIHSSEHEYMEIEEPKIESHIVVLEEEINTWTATIELIKSSLPTIFAILFQLFLEVINISFVGNLNDPDGVAAVGLSWLTLNAFIIAPGYGLCGGIDTLVSTAYGNKQYYLWGVYLNRARIVQFIIWFPFIVFLIFSGWFFDLIGQEETVSRMSEVYIWVSLPGMLWALQFQATKRFMMAQKVFRPITYFQVFLLVQHLLVSILLIYVLKVGYIGAAIATTSTNFIALVGLSLMLKWTSLVEKDAFHFFNKDSFTGLLEYMHIGVPSMFMLVIEWVTFELMGIYAGIIGVYYLGANTIMGNISAVFYMIPMGLSFATIAHVGNALGKGEYKVAHKYFLISFWISWCTGVISTVTLALLYHPIFSLYTQDENILNAIYESATAFIAFMFFSNIQGNAKGIFKSIGRQTESAIVNGIMYIALGNPLSILLGLKLGMKLAGIWVGMGMATVLWSFYFTFRLCTIDWKELSVITLRRIKYDKKKISVKA